MATDHNFRIKNGLEVGGQLIVNSSGQLVVADISANQKFLDNVKLRFGNSSDLQIYHDSSAGHSIITDVGTGNLLIRGTSLNLQDAAGYNYIVMEDTGNGGVVKLRHNDVTKLETTSGGVSVTGQLNLTGNAVFNTGSKAIFGGDDTYNAHLQYTDNGSGDHFLSIKTEHNNVITERAKFHAGTGDITFSGDTTFANNLTVTGNLNITGDINSTSVTNLDVVDKTITVANNAGSSSNANGAGIIVDTGGTLPSILWDHANQRFNFSYKANFAGTPTVNGVSVLTTNAGINANNINSGTISSARLPTNINADTLDNLNSTEFLRSNTATYYAAGSVGFDLHGGPLASQTMNSHHGLANNGSISDFFMYKHFDVWSKNGSTWTEYGHCDGITDGDYSHQWGGLTLARTNQEYIIEIANQMGYAFINGLKFQHSTNGNSFAIYFETKESYTNVYESGWTTVASLTGIGSWPGGTTWRLSTAVGASYHDNVRLRIVPTWNGGNTNTITFGSLQCFGSYGVATPGFKVTHDRTMNVINGLQVNGNSVIDSSRNFITNGSLYFQGATNSSFITGSSGDIRYAADAKHYFQTYNGGWSTRAEITDDYLSVVDGKELRAYRAGNSAYASLFMDSGEKLYIRNSWGTKDIVMLRTGEVGIGVGTPTHQLNVVGASGTSVVQSIRNPNTGWSQYALTRYGSEGADVRYMDFGYYRGSSEATRGLVVKSQANATLVTFLDNGNVGIGNPSPSYKLDITQATTNQGAVNVSDGTSWLRLVPSLGAGGFNSMSQAGDLGIIFSTDNNSSSSTGGLTIAPWSGVSGNQGMRIMESGNVGIGNPTPQRRLTVTEASAGSASDNTGILSLTVGSGANTDSKMAFGIDSNHAGWIHVVKPGNNVMPLLLNPTNSSNGRVGIGTNPTSNYKLHVKGPTFIDGTAEAQTPLRIDKDRDGARIGFTYAGNPISSEIGLTYQSVSQQKLWIGANINSTGTGHVGTTQANSNHPSQYIVMDSGGDDITFNRITSGTNSVRYRFQPTLLTMETDDGGDIYLGHDGTFGATGNGRYVALGLGGRTNGSNRIFAHSGTSDGLYLCAATGHSIMFRPNGEGLNHLTVSTSSIVSTIPLTVQTGGVYAPVFYDQDSTSFYADPAGTSRFEQIEFRNGSGIQQPVGNLSDGFMHYRWGSLVASGTQAKRYKIMRLYFCPAHWSGEWQNIDLTLHNVTFQTGSKKYKITAEYNGGYQNESININCVEKCGYETERYHVWIDSPVDAGWDHSSANVYYADVYVDVSHYMQVKPHIQCNDHSFTTTTPTSGGYATLIYTSPTGTNITYSNAGFMAHGNKKHHLDIVNTTATTYAQKLLSFGSAGAGATSANNNAGAWGSLEGYTDSGGEGSGRLFFREHNSATGSADSYGMSLGYRGGGTSVRTAAGGNWTGLSSIGNGEWGMFGHDGNIAGALIMYGDRAATNINFDSNELRNMSNIKLNDLIYHNGNTAAWVGFDATDRFRINASSSMISSSVLTMSNSRLYFDNNGPGAGNYDIHVGAQGSARAMTMAPYATFGTDYSGWSANIGTNTRPKIGTTSSGFELASGFLTAGAALANFGFNQLNWYRWEPSALTGMSEGSDLTLGTPKFFVNADQGTHTGSFRAPIFYDSANTAFYVDPASTGSDTAARFRGGALFGPNTSWNEYLSVGGDGRWTTAYATVSSTNGNLHLDAKNGNSIYLAWYNTSAVYVGGDIRATIFYDRDNVAYYGNFAGNSVMNTVDVASLDATGNIQAGGSVIGGTSSSNSDGQNNQPFKLDVDRSSYMMSVAGNTWGLFWAGNSGAKYGSNQGEGSDIWGNVSNPNEFSFVGSDTTGWTTQGHTGRVWQKGDLYVHNYSTTVYSASTQGQVRGSIHIDPNSATDHAGGAITFGASDSGSGRVGQAGIYIRSDGSYGTRMYLSTTDSYATGSKTALSIQQNGNIVAERAAMYASAFYDNNSTAYYIDPNNSNIAASARLRNGIAFDREGDTGGAGDFSTYLDATNYPPAGYNSTNQRYWHRLISKGGTHIVLNSDGGNTGSENSMDHFTIFEGGHDSYAKRKFYVTNVGNVHAKGNITAYQTSNMSDIRLKKDIKPLEGSLEKVLGLQGVSFKWKESSKEAIGFIAQDVEKVEPLLVNETNEISTNELMKTVDYSTTVALLVEAIKEQQGIINRLEKEVNDLKNK